MRAGSCVSPPCPAQAAGCPSGTDISLPGRVPRLEPLSSDTPPTPPCHLRALLIGYLAAFGLNLLIDLLLVGHSLRGAPFELSKRRWVEPLLYAATLPLGAGLSLTGAALLSGCWALGMLGRATNQWAACNPCCCSQPCCRRHCSRLIPVSRAAGPCLQPGART